MPDRMRSCSRNYTSKLDMTQGIAKVCAGFNKVFEVVPSYVFR